MTALSLVQNGWTHFHRRSGDAASPDSATMDLIDILDTVDVPIVVILRDFTLACFNRAAKEIFCLAPSDVGLSPRDIPLFTSLRDLEEWCTQVNATGEPCRHNLRHGGKSFGVRIAPYTKDDRRIIGTVLTFTNVTAFRASIDQAIYEREYTKAILNTVPDPLVVLGPDLQVKTGNRAFYALFQLSREQTQDVPLGALAEGAFDRSRLRTQLLDMLADGIAFQPFEVDHRFPRRGQRTIMIDARELSLPGKPERMVLLAFRDITDRKHAERTQLLLVGEMQHRVKNTLASVQAIARQTLRHAPSAERDAFAARLDVLSSAHDLLKRETWDRAAVADVVSRALEPFQQDRFLASGPELFIAADKSLMLTMAIHELGTNAVKHGALSNGTGKITIVWELVQDSEPRRLRFHWQESGGPPVVPPRQIGFGLHLLPQTLDGPGIEFRPDGVRCTLETEVYSG